jgi:hypothetical protein
MSDLHRYIGGLFQIKGVKINGIHTHAHSPADIGLDAIAYHDAFFDSGAGQFNGMFKYQRVGFVNAHYFGYNYILKIAARLVPATFISVDSLNPFEIKCSVYLFCR